MVHESGLPLLSLKSELTLQSLLVHTDTHAGHLKRAFKHRIPQKQVTVETFISILIESRPVIIVGSSSVMRLPIRKFSTDSDDKHRLMFLDDCILPFLRTHLRILLQKILRMNEENILRKHRFDLRKLHIKLVLSHLDSLIDSSDNLLEVIQTTLLLGNDSFPVPLVYIYRMDIIKFLIRTKGVHVGINTTTRLYIHLCKLDTFPFRKRMHDLSALLIHILDRKIHRTLNAVEIIIQTGTAQHDHRSCHSQERKLCRQVILKHIFYGLDCLLSIFYVAKYVTVAFGEIK